MKKNILAASVAAALAFALPALAQIQAPVSGGAEAAADVKAGANVGGADVKAGASMGGEVKAQGQEQRRATSAPAQTQTQKRVLPRQAKSKAGAEGEAKTQN